MPFDVVAATRRNWRQTIFRMAELAGISTRNRRTPYLCYSLKSPVSSRVALSVQLYKNIIWTVLLLMFQRIYRKSSYHRIICIQSAAIIVILHFIWYSNILCIQSINHLSNPIYLTQPPRHLKGGRKAKEKLYKAMWEYCDAIVAITTLLMILIQIKTSVLWFHKRNYHLTCFETEMNE